MTSMQGSISAPDSTRRYAALMLSLLTWVLGIALALVTITVPAASAAGPDAIMTPPGYNANVIPRGDDTSALVVDLPFTMNWNGTLYTQIYINMNGNCTFGQAFSDYNPSTTLAATNRNIMAPFWADVDTRNPSSGQVTYSNTAPGSVPTVNGRPAFFVNWIDVARYNNQASPLNSFQLVIVDRSDTGAGNFDFIFNYDRIAWDIATTASTFRARAGWGFAGTGFELPGSGVPQTQPSALLDTSPPATSLIQNSLNSGGQLGRYVFQVRNGQPPNLPPEFRIMDPVLEGNRPGAHIGYDPYMSDVTVTDPDGSIVSVMNDFAPVLPLGTTVVAWWATDNRDAVTEATQTITVRDTSPPSGFALTSATHAPGVWSTTPTVSVASSESTDACSGVSVASYAWTRNAPADPDPVPDPSIPGTFSVAVVATASVTPESQIFTASWPADWTRVRIAGAGDPTTYLRVQSARAAYGHAAEVWTDANGTRRTFGFYKDFDLSDFISAALTYSDYTTGLDAGTDHTRLEYSTDSGASWVTLRSVSTNAAWTQRSFNLPTGSVIRIRFSGSVDRTNEFCDWDNIVISGVKRTSATLSNSTARIATTTALDDGVWYFNARMCDHAENWGPRVSYGPVQIDQHPPVTTSDAPAWWVNSPVLVSLVASDAGGIAHTRYAIDDGPWSPYSSPIPVSSQGVTTIWFYSVDLAGHVEATRSATVRIDMAPLTVPVDPMASASSTSSAEVSWGVSAEPLSGVSYYAVYRDGSLVATSNATVFVDTGLTAGRTYTYEIVAVDHAGNESLPSAPATVFIPESGIGLSISEPLVDLGIVEAETTASAPAATAVAVGGLGEMSYTLYTSATDFVSDDPGPGSPVIEASALAYRAYGNLTTPITAFMVSPRAIGIARATGRLWSHGCTFDLFLRVPYDVEPTRYVTTVTLTVIVD